MVFRVPRSESNPTILKNTSAIRNIFFRRSLRAIEELQSLDEKTLAEAVQAPTDYSVLLWALNTEEALASIRAHDPLAGARLRGLEAKRRLLEAEGGALSTAEIAKALRITRQAVDKRRKERKLLGVEVGKKGFRYPTWQIGLPHLEEVLKALGDRDSWEQIAFFLNPSALLEDRTPLEVLQEGNHDIDDVLRAASVYGEQGA
jgi:biotin operon repressor